ncbi:hypothetical protein PIB30_028645 [Stylosanthes scabra]|uniref:Uncharacterized protein n=1 Tax=Stylosanthes scabra TaxID=79078 RepID=A0ABU6QAI0_9FABA|nr:hypothetical protein [Stylosanthes scabra]
MKLKKSNVQVKLPIEGYRLAHLTPDFKYKGNDNIDLFYHVFTKLLKARSFKDGELNLAPFAKRSIGPNWFTQDRVKLNGNAQRVVDEHWANYLAVQVIPNSFPQYKASRFRVYLHSPHFMAQNLLTRTFYDALDCEPSGFVTKGFIKWWDAYYKQYNRTLNDIIKGSTEKTKQLKEAEEAAEKERKRKEAEKEAAEGSMKEAHGEKKARKRKSESSKTTSKRAKANPKKIIQTSDILEESIPSGVNPKSASVSEKTRPSESVHSSSEDSSKEVSSKSKESTNSKKSKQTKQVADDIDDSTDPEYEPLQIDNQAQNQNPPQSEDSSKGYSPSPTQENIDDSDAQQVKKVSNVETNNPSSSLTNKGILQKVVPFTPNIPIRPGTNRGIPIDPRVQFQERLEEVRSENVRRVKESVRPLPSIPIINIEADDELEDLLKVISETKELIDQPLESLQKDAYWNNELVVFTSCLVEKQFLDAYREKIQCFPKIFDSLFHTRENLSNLRLKATLVKENCDALATAESDFKEKDAFYEKHLNNANTMLEGLSTERAILVKKLAEIQAQIQEIDDKTSKIKKPLDKIVGKKVEIQNKLLEINENQKLNEEDLKKIQKEEDEETQLFKSLCEDKIQLKETLQLFLKEIDN